MKRLNNYTIRLLSLSFFIISSSSFAAMEDDPLLMKVMIDKLELSEEDDDANRTVAWESDLWIGKDQHKLWLKSSGERVDGKQETSTSALYSTPIDANWDFQVGWLHDTVPNEKRDYAELGIKGVAPYYFETDASIALGKDGHSKLSMSAEYEMMLTQRLVLSPEVEFTAYGKSDEKMEVGSGLASGEIGLRLRYEIRREFAPYIGINFEKKFGQTADIATEEGEETSETQFVIGIRAWF
jgi:copper resistance protein B